MSQVGYLDGVFSTALLSNSMKGAGEEPSIAVPYQGPKECLHWEIFQDALQ